MVRLPVERCPLGSGPGIPGVTPGEQLRHCVALVKQVAAVQRSRPTKPISHEITQNDCN